MSVFLTFMAAAASFAAPSCMMGSWALHAEGTVIFKIEVVNGTDGADVTWIRPDRWQTDGESFSRMEGPAVRREARSVGLEEGDLEATFGDPEPGEVPDVLRLRCGRKGGLRITYQGTPIPPFELEQSSAGEVVGDWDPTRIYTRVVRWPSSEEMEAIFEADQADRRATTIDWERVAERDQARMSRTAELLQSGALQSGDDFYFAALIYQHGDKPADYLKAHLLATIAAARGKRPATWMAAATLDRYLQSIGQPQVAGTQFSSKPGSPTTQEPYDRTVISDALREALGVPPLSEQEKQREQYDEMRRGGTH